MHRSDAVGKCRSGHQHRAAGDALHGHADHIAVNRIAEAGRLARTSAWPRRGQMKSGTALLQVDGSQEAITVKRPEVFAVSFEVSGSTVLKLPVSGFEVM